MKPTLAHAGLAGGLAAAFGFYLISDRIDSYWLHICTLVGINIILAVSLNLINGYTGQFSLGHAGFMAVGAYAAAAVTMFAGPRLLPLLGGKESGFALGILFVLALLVAGVVASVAGIIVG